MFQDNGLPESLAGVLVKEQGVACDPGLPPVQPSSPYQLARHGVLRHQPPNLGPDWAAISGTCHRTEEQGYRGRGAKLQPATLGTALKTTNLSLNLAFLCQARNIEILSWASCLYPLLPWVLGSLPQ